MLVAFPSRHPGGQPNGVVGMMSELLQLIAGAEVRCTDGRVGHVGGLIFDPRAGAVTHLSVDTHSAIHSGRLVPLGEVQSASPVVELVSARHDYDRLPANEEFVMAAGAGRPTTTLHVHLVPHGDTELNQDETIHAADGRAGHLVGIIVDRDSCAVQDLLVRVGHLSRRRQVSVPFQSVTTIDRHGIHLGLTRDQLSAQPELT